MLYRLHIILLLFCLSLPIFAGREQGDSALQRGDFALAKKCYLESLKKSPDAATYYNLGVACYRLHQTPEAVVAFRHALQLKPGDADTRYNLEVIESQLQDQFSAPSRMFFLRWLYALRLSLSATAWAVWALLCFVLCLGSFIFYRLAFVSGRSSALTKSAFAISVLFLILTVTFNIFAYRQYGESKECVAVVIKETPLRDGPSATSRVVRTVHPGVTLALSGALSSHSSSALSVTLPDGTAAWLSDTTAVTFVGR